MHIDLLRAHKGALGLLADAAFDEEISGVIFDQDLCQLTLEFGESMDSLPLNIPVAHDFIADVNRETQLHIGTVQKGRITHASLVSLISGEFAEFGIPKGRHMPIFERTHQNTNHGGNRNGNHHA